MKICWANAEGYDESDVIVVGVPDESESHAARKGASEGPERIREISRARDLFVRDGVARLGLPFAGEIKCKVFDRGNIAKGEIEGAFDDMAARAKIPILLGGDHSNTRDAVKGIAKRLGPITLVYFDAHPDFVSSAGSYYGSVFNDLLPFLDLKTSLQIGIRTPEPEEADNLRRHQVRVVTTLEILEKGLRPAAEELATRVARGANVYISLDLDCIDPAHAPGVSVPVPMGLSSVETMFLIETVLKTKRIVGLDVMEYCPRFDREDMTGHLASRIIGEALARLRR